MNYTDADRFPATPQSSDAIAAKLLVPIVVGFMVLISVLSAFGALAWMRSFIVNDIFDSYRTEEYSDEYSVWMLNECFSGPFGDYVPGPYTYPRYTSQASASQLADEQATGAGTGIYEEVAPAVVEGSGQMVQQSSQLAVTMADMQQAQLAAQDGGDEAAEEEAVRLAQTVAELAEQESGAQTDEGASQTAMPFGTGTAIDEEQAVGLLVDYIEENMDELSPEDQEIARLSIGLLEAAQE